MATTMEEFLNQEEASSKRIAHGDIIDGVVVRVDPDEVLVDVGSKSEGVISSRELGTKEAGTLTCSRATTSRSSSSSPRTRMAMLSSRCAAPGPSRSG